MLALDVLLRYELYKFLVHTMIFQCIRFNYTKEQLYRYI